MSYQRSPYPLTYSYGVSKMYVYDDGIAIRAYNYSHADMIEMLIENWETKDIQFKNWFIKTLAHALKVRLRDVPLEDYGEEYNKISEKIHQRIDRDLRKQGFDV